MKNLRKRMLRSVNRNWPFRVLGRVVHWYAEVGIDPSEVSGFCEYRRDSTIIIVWFSKDICNFLICKTGKSESLGI